MTNRCAQYGHDHVLRKTEKNDKTVFSYWKCAKCGNEIITEQEQSTDENQAREQ
jgi:ribosomal protein S27E